MKNYLSVDDVQVISPVSIGSRTIRTEEAVLIALTALEDKLNPMQRPIKTELSQFVAQSEDTGVKQFIPNNNQKNDTENK